MPIANVDRSGAVTRANASRFSEDARVLAARESANGWIPAALATEIDADLKRSRATVSALESIRARSTFDPDSVLVTVTHSAPWFEKWNSGTRETGVTAIDTISTTYRLTGVSRVTINGDRTIFKLTFADPLVTSYIAQAYQSADAGVVDASSNGMIGDGDDITRVIGTNFREYVFSRGWGDCFAGCIRRHNWSVRLASDGNITVTESGVPLP